MSDMHEKSNRQPVNVPEEALSPAAQNLSDSAFNHGLSAMVPIVEERLMNLKVGEELLLNERLHECDRGDITMLTFKKTESGEFEVTNGINSLNGTHILVDGVKQQIESFAPVKGGELMAFGSSRVIVPNERFAAETPLQFALEDLSPGDSLLIGRNYFPELGTKTSRQHATITRGEDYEGPDGHPKALYLLSDSIKHSRAVLVDTPEGGFEEIEGKTTIGPGRSIKIAGGPTIDLPEPMAKLNYTQMVQGQQSPLASMTQSMMSMDMRSRGGSMTMMFRAPQDLDESRMIVAPVKAQLLGLHIHEGLRLIRQEKYAEARKHFNNERVLEECGFRLDQGNMIWKNVTEITAKDVYDVIQQAAGRSWFMRDGHNNGRVIASYGHLMKEGELSPKEEMLLKELDREVCLIEAEERIHAYQMALGGPVSKRGALLEYIPGERDVMEHDVAQLFVEQKVPMSPMYTQRYGRDEALKKLTSYTSPVEQKNIRATLLRAELNKPIVFGRRPAGDPQVRIETVTEGLRPDLAALRSQNLSKQVASVHATVTPRGAGRYDVRPVSDGTPVFQRDSHGIWRALKGTETLRSGQRVRLGSSFEFKLP